MKINKTNVVKLPASLQSILEKIISVAQPNKVLLFGSRARGDFRENSDFDIYITGRRCSEDDWTRLLVDLDTEPLTLFKIDLVEFEKMSREFQESMGREGIILYG